MANEFKIKNGLISPNLSLTDTTNSTSSTVGGTLTVSGGGAIAQDLHVGGTLFATVSTVANLAGGSASQIPYQSAASTTSFIANGTSGQLLTSNGASAPTWNSSINGISIGATTASTGRFTTVESTVTTGTAPFIVASTTNVANLNASSLNGATFASPGPIGSSTASTGAFSTLTASSTVTLSPASANVAISPTGTGSVTISPATTVTISPTGALTINPAAASTINNTSIGATTRSTGAFTTLTANGITTLTSSTASTGLNTGALQISGGTSISGDLYVGGTINLSGVAVQQIGQITTTAAGWNLP